MSAYDIVTIIGGGVLILIIIIYGVIIDNLIRSDMIKYFDLIKEVKEVKEVKDDKNEVLDLRKEL